MTMFRKPLIFRANERLLTMATNARGDSIECGRRVHYNASMARVAGILRVRFGGTSLLLALLLPCCQHSQPPEPAAERFPAINTPHIPNVHRVTDKVIAGALPEGEEGYAELARLGVKTVIDVDGVAPNLELARRYGLQYVHLPFGYGGVPERRGEEIAKAIQEFPGPVYIHCHHGKHRAAAAAAVGCIEAGMVPPDEAEEILKTFGTGAEYKGLWQSARDARPLDPRELADLKVQYVAVAKLPPLAETMVTIDHRMDELKLLSKNRWLTPPSHPDLDSPDQALQLYELLHELGRSGKVASRPEDFRAHLAGAESAAQGLQEKLKGAIDVAGADGALKTLITSCESCHLKYRD